MLVWSCLEWRELVSSSPSSWQFPRTKGQLTLEWDELLCFGKKQNSNKCRRNRGNWQELFLEYTKARDCLYSILWGTNQHNIHLLIMVNKYWLSALCQPLMGHLEMQIWTWQTRIFWGCLPKSMRDRYLVKAVMLESCEEVRYKSLQECLRQWDHCVPRLVFAFLLLIIQLYLFESDLWQEKRKDEAGARK